MSRNAEDRVYVRLEGEEKERWLAACADSRTDQQTAARALMRTFWEGDPLVRSVLLGAVPLDADVAKLFVERLMRGKGRK